MLRHPLTEQGEIVGGPDGKDVTYVLKPASCSKSTAVAPYGMATEGVGRPEDLKRALEPNHSPLRTDEVRDLVAALEKVQ